MEIWIQILISVLSSTTFFILLLPFAEKWLFVRLEKSIENEYDRKLEDYKFAQLQRQKSELIAELFAKWIKYRGRERKILDQKELIDYYENLNRISIEISLWLPDVEILNNIMDRLEMKKDDAKTIHNLIGDVRKLILNNSDSFNSDRVILWPKSEDVGDVMDKRT